MNKYKILNQIITPSSKVSSEFLEKCMRGDKPFRYLMKYPMLGDLVIFRIWDAYHPFSKAFNMYIGKVIAINYNECMIRATYHVREDDGNIEGMDIIKCISTTWDKVYPINLSNDIIEDLGFERYLYRLANYKLNIQGGSLYINAYKKGRRIENGYREFFYLKKNNNNKGYGKYLHQLVAYIKNLELETAINIEANLELEAGEECENNKII